MTPEQEAAVVAEVEEDANIGRPVRIRWIDSGIALHGWQPMERIREERLSTIETVGLWMGHSSRAAMVAGSRDPNAGNWGECQLIWRDSIIEFEYLDAPH